MKENESLASPRELIVIERKSSNESAGLFRSAIDVLGPILENEGATIDAVFDGVGFVDERAPFPLDSFYRVAAHDEKLEKLADLIRPNPAVHAAYIKPGAELPIIEHGFAPGPQAEEETPDFTHLQSYLNSAPEGIGARVAWTHAGGTGNGVKLIDVEGAWNFAHEDLQFDQADLIGGRMIDDWKWRKHGTAVLGMLCGKRNGYGVDGICPDAEVKTVSVFSDARGTSNSNWGTASAIKFAADNLDEGDILLVEMHRPGPTVNFEENEPQNGYVAVEWWPCDWAAIKYATSERKVIVVEAAGNGGLNLIDPTFSMGPKPPFEPFPRDWRDPFPRIPFDSGAIVVGAGMTPFSNDMHAPNGSRIRRSNYGSCVDVQGWGTSVVTCGFNPDLQDDVSENRHYTLDFNSTSSAAAMIAGTLVCLQGIARAIGKVITPAEARRLLADGNHGLFQTAGVFAPLLQHIGPRPDLAQLIPLI